MITTLLFDLDNTLLENNMDRFIPEFLYALAARFDHLFSRDWFIQQVLTSTREMVDNQDPSKTNQGVFFESLVKRLGHPLSVLKPIFDQFYAHDFDKLKVFAKRVPEAKDIMEEAFNQGYKVAIATNPIFPLSAMMNRLNWAGISEFQYVLITSYEVMHFCKPHVGYYQEILNTLDVKAHQCLMVGDDIKNDLHALSIGIRTFLVTDFIQNLEGKRYTTTFQGSLKDFRRMLKSFSTKNLPLYPQL
ncbi:MAG TPA: HAD family hydrolase [Syntrophaceae bacterium]|nr:HAD family hydrolase [Syntrophaceae bacterium]